MRPIRDTLPLDAALHMLLQAATPIETIERVPLEQADGRVVSHDLVASADVPPFDRAAMDGYAVVADDTFGASPHHPRILKRVEKVYTGEVPTRVVSPGQCTEIATGAPMPQGATAVVMVEETEHGEEDEVRVFTPVYPGQNVGRRGADITAGRTVVAEGTLITPSVVGAIAAIGIAEAHVYRKPHVAILSTGNEIVEPGRPLAPGQIYDINRFTLSAIIARHGGVPVPQPIAADTLQELQEAIERALEYDAIVFSGGSSVGERDLIMDVLHRMGEVLFHGVALKPGKPTVFGKVNDTPVLGMPGYPTSCLSNAYMLLVPLLRRMARLPEYRPRTIRVPLSRRVVSTTGRHQFYTVRVQDGLAHPAFKASGDITSMADADGYIEIPAQTDILEAGEMIDVKLFA